MKLLLLIIVLLAHGAGMGQAGDTIIITPGSDLIASANLTDYQASYDFISYKDGKESRVGGLEENFSVFSKDGTSFGLRVCHISFGANNILDSGLCYLQGLVPVYHRSIQTARRMSFDFGKEGVRGEVISQKDPPVIDTVNYHSPVLLFDSYYEDILAKTIRLQEGLIFKFAEYIYERGGTVWSTGEVVGKQETKENPNENNLWTIRFWEKDKTDQTVRTTTYLVNEMDRTIVSREYDTRNGKTVMLLHAKKG